MFFDDMNPGAGAGAPAAAPPAAPVSADPGASPAPGGVPPSPGGSPESPNIRQLREQYETTKQKLDPWEKLGAKPEDVQRSHSTYTKLVSEVNTLGASLGYSPQELQDAMETDLAGTIAVLRQAAKQAQGTEQPLSPAQIQKLIRDGVQTGLKPYQERDERAMDQAAEVKFDGEFDRQFKTSFPHGLPDSAREALSGLAWQIVSDNKDGYQALRSKGDVNSVAKAFEMAKKTLLTIITDYGAHEKKRIGGDPGSKPAEGHGAKKGQSLDDMLARLGNENVPMTEIFGK